VTAAEPSVRGRTSPEEEKMNSVASRLTALSAGTDPGVRPSWDLVPGWVRTMFTGAAGTAMSIALVACVVGFILAGVMLWVAHRQGSYGGGSTAKTYALAVAAGTIVVAGSSSFVAFFASQAG
jgi:hypothetical protein